MFSHDCLAAVAISGLCVALVDTSFGAEGQLPWFRAVLSACAQVLQRLGFAGTSVAKTAKSQARVILFNYWCAPAPAALALASTESSCGVG